MDRRKQAIKNSLFVCVNDTINTPKKNNVINIGPNKTVVDYSQCVLLGLDRSRIQAGGLDLSSHRKLFKYTLIEIVQIVWNVGES